MEIIDRSNQFHDDWFSGLRDILEKSFVNKSKIDNKTNAYILRKALKTKDFDKENYVKTIENLSEEEWSKDYVVKTLNKLNSITGLSPKYVKDTLDPDLKEEDYNEIMWELLKKIIIDYAAYTKEFYDYLKYSEELLNEDKDMLMLTIMKALKKVHTASSELREKYQFKNYNKTSMNKFLEQKLSIDHLLLRINFILINIGREDKVRKYAETLSNEIAEHTVSQAK